MARKRGSFGKFMVLVVLVLAAVGGYTILEGPLGENPSYIGHW